MHEIVIRKDVERFHSEKGRIQVEQIIEAAITPHRSRRGWTASPARIEQKDKYVTAFFIIARSPVEGISVTELTNEQEWEDILLSLQSACDDTKPPNKWKLESVDKKKHEEIKPDPTRAVGYADVIIPANYMDYFSHIYGLDDQIDIIMSRIQAGIDSQWANRFHCTLVGQPASGKSETAKAIKKMLGEDAVLEYDATSTTMAGAIKDLSERPILPRILIVEEIEKTDDMSFRWLLGVMDTRAEIRKVNFRVSIHKETKLLAIVTVNNYKMFQSKMEGALASRGGEAIYFDRPNRARLEMILEREIKKVEGAKTEWIKPTLDYALAVGIEDPRSIIPICLAGKDKLLDYSYQMKLISTLTPDRRETYKAALSKILLGTSQKEKVV